MPALSRRTFLKHACVVSCTCGFSVAARGAPRAANAAKPAVPYDYMGQLRAAESEAAAAEQSGDDSRKRNALNMLATQQSFVGDTESAIDTFGRAGYRTGARTLPEEEARHFVTDHEVHDALAAILEQTRDRQIVMINEAHHVPRDRAFSTLVALELRKLGFQYLAMETFTGDAPALVSRGYPLAEADGYYSREPVFGDLIRRAVAAGYQPVAYEAMNIPENLGPDERVDYREEKEAQNLIAAAMGSGGARARILVHVGYGHLRKGAVDSGNGKTRTLMAERLKAKTGIDPYCIDQTQLIPSNTNITDAIYFQATSDSFALRSRTADNPNPYSDMAGVDMLVYHRPTKEVDGRPDWLAMRGYRTPRPIPTKLLPKSGRRLVQAFVEGESVDAVPMDQVLVTAGGKPPDFMLPKGKYRFAWQD